MADLRFNRYRNDLRLTHYLFRFPAKFHPPALRYMIDEFSKPGDRLLDPFCGSGTLLVEALVRGRPAIGLDVDPVATFISRIKATPLQPKRLESAFEILTSAIQRIRRPPSQYDALIHEDLAPVAVDLFRRRYAIPPIPRINHWFRRYVTIDLARLRLAILGARIPEDARRFFMGCFASIVRNASNADPVPVSGLEVTSHMRQLDKKGRRIDPFDLFEQKVRKGVAGMSELWDNAKSVEIGVRCGDATRLSRYLPAECADVVLTSPPYNTAVDYYRRHTLEMYWLGLVASHEERLELAPTYLGRAQVKKVDPRLRWEPESLYLKRLLRHAENIGPERARALKHYACSMQKVLVNIARVLKPKGRAVIVIGNSKWNGRRVRPTKLLEELSNNHFRVDERYSYPTHNRYMSYSRHNNADIGREHVLVLKKKS